MDDRAILESGVVEVGGVSFSWSVDDRADPVVTVSRPGYGSLSEAAIFRPRTLARLLAKELLAKITAAGTVNG